MDPEHDHGGKCGGKKRVYRICEKDTVKFFELRGKKRKKKVRGKERERNSIKGTDAKKGERSKGNRREGAIPRVRGEAEAETGSLQGVRRHLKEKFCIKESSIRLTGK